MKSEKVEVGRVKLFTFAFCLFTKPALYGRKI